MKCAYKLMMARQDSDRMDKQENKAIAYTLALALQTAKDVFSYSPDDLKDLLNGMYSVASDAFEYYADDKAQRYDAETVPFIEQGLKNRIEASECDVTEIEKPYWFSMADMPARAKYDRELRSKFRSRLGILLDRELSLKPYWYSFLVYMAEDKEIDGAELTKFYTELRKQYYEVWGWYLELLPRKDAALAKEVDRLLKEMSDMGVEIDTRTNKERKADKEKELENSKGENDNG